MGLYLLFFSLLPYLITAQTVQNSFIYPPPSTATNFSADVVWTLGSTQTIQWYCNFTTWRLLLLQHNDLPDDVPGGNAGGVMIGNGSNSGSGQQEGSFTWDVATSLNFVTYPVFWFQFYNGSAENSAFNSDYINITSSTSTTTSSTSSPTNTHTATPKPSLSTGAEIGIGVAIPIFVIAMSVAAFFYWRSRRSKTVINEPGAEAEEYQKPELAVNEARRYELGEYRDSPENGIERHEMGEP